MTAATGDPSPWPAADIRISTLPYELLARVIFHARARVIIARCASGESDHDLRKPRRKVALAQVTSMG
jgi:hypothetical protein